MSRLNGTLVLFKFLCECIYRVCKFSSFFVKTEHMGYLG